MSTENRDDLFGAEQTPKKQPTNPEGFVSRVYEVSDEDSTIFSAPSEHREKVRKKSRLVPILLSCISLVLVVAISVTTVILWPVPEEEEEDGVMGVTLIQLIDDSVFYNITEYDETENEDGTVTKLPVIGTGNVLVDRVVLNRSDYTLEFILDEYEQETTDDDGNPTTKTKKEWALKNVDRSLTSYATIDNAVTSYMEQSYTKVISEDKNDGRNYGFDNPEYTVDFYKPGSDDIYISLIIGGKSPADDGRYVTTSKDNRVYFVRSTDLYHYEKTDLDFVNAESIPAIAADEDYSSEYFTDGQLISCERLELWGKVPGDHYDIITKTVDHDRIFNAYHIVSPVERPADDDSMGNVVSLFSYGIASTGCYSYSTAPEELKKFGLDDPDFGVKIYVNDVESSFVATLQEDGNYAVYYADNKTIMKVAADSLIPAAYTKKEIFNELLFIEDISATSTVTVESAGEKVSFDISTKYDEESDNDVISGVRVNGKSVTTLNFQNYYSYLIQISPQSYEVVDTKGMTPVTVLTLEHKNGSDPTVVKYFKISDSRYQVETNGVKMGLISSSEHTRVMKYAKNVAENKTYNSR